MKTFAACALAIVLGSIPGLSQAQSDVDAKMVAKGALAPSDKKPEEGPWSGAVAGGYAKTSGNSRSTVTNLKAEGRYDQNRWHHILGATAVAADSAASRADVDTKNTGEAYWAGFQSQYDITESIYGFGSVDWYKDRFSAYDSQLFETAGAGWRVLRGEVHFLDLEAGYGLTQSDPVIGDRDSEGVALIRGLYKWQISETAAFVQKVTLLDSSSNTYLQSDSELRAAIVGNLNLVLGYTVKRNSDVADPAPPAVAFEKKDTFTTVSLQYTF
jgi:putative salt-induced outer membrane protein